MTRRSFVRTLSSAAATAALTPSAPASARPNIVLIVADDLGFGDLGCYGSRIRTPHLDALAQGGVLLRNFCSASPVCSPSRAALLTGRYGVRGGVPHVLGPLEPVGLSLDETTLPAALKAAGYRTACVGKWHLGARSPYLPTERGFDQYFGIPYSNDHAPSVMLRNKEVVEAPVELATITLRYARQAVEFIRQAKESPFFLYLAHAAPHLPLVASRDFRGKSPLGVYGDVVEEMDASVGQVLAELTAQGLDQNTLVIFTSDNGPWFQGSTERLRGRKGDTFEGGMRVPFLARWPGRLPEGVTIDTFATMLDLFPTIAHLAQAPASGTALDGVNVWPLLAGESDAVERPPFLYFDGNHLQCARLGRWKLHISRANGPAFAPPPEGGRVNLPLLNPELYDVEADPGESYNVAAENPTVVKELRAQVEELITGLPPAVRSAWRDTLVRPAAAVNAGEWPWPK